MNISLFISTHFTIVFFTLYFPSLFFQAQCTTLYWPVSAYSNSLSVLLMYTLIYTWPHWLPVLCRLHVSFKRQMHIEKRYGFATSSWETSAPYLPLDWKILFTATFCFLTQRWFDMHAAVTLASILLTNLPCGMVLLSDI